MQKKVCLIYPRFHYPSGDPPLGILYVAAYLKKEINDLDLRFIDTTFNPTLNFVIKRLEEFRPGIVGIYMDTLMYKNAIRIAAIAKKFSAEVVVGGPHPTILPDSVIRNKFIDAIIQGEAEQSFTEYVREFYKNKRFEKIPGLWYKNNHKIIKNNTRKNLIDLDSLPLPDLGLLDMNRYINNWFHFGYMNNIRGTSIIGSRGCTFNCSYCQPTLIKMFGNKIRRRSSRNMIAELKSLRQEYNINAFHLQDDTSTSDREWILDFSKKLIQSKLNFSWSCNSRADTLSIEMVKWMKRSGLKEIRIGIESISPRIRNDLYSKNLSLAQINKSINLIKKNDLMAFGYFMLGAPGETEQEIKDTIKFASSSRLDVATFSIATPIPGTLLYQKIFNNQDMNEFNDFNYYKVTRNFSSIPRIRLKYYKKLAYLRFYLHPKRIKNSLIEIHHIRKILNKLKRF
ncbi:radical SAM protein [Candidatus Woesearchaeota archaeon]|nr:radical SAM protein [Candidatus Woesearchaeota archaeon]